VTRRERGFWVQLQRWALRLLLGLVALVALVALSVLALTQNEAVAEFALQRALPVVNEALPGEIRAGGLDGNLGRHLILTDVEVLDGLGKRAAFVPRLEVVWNLWDLIRMEVNIDRVVLQKPDVLVAIREEGGLNWASAFVDPDAEKKPKKPKDPNQGPSPLFIDVRELVIEDGVVRVELAKGEPFAFEGIQLAAAYSLDGLTLHDAVITDFRATTTSPWELGEVALSGDAQLDGLDLTLGDFDVAWKNNKVRLAGTLAPLNKLVFGVDVSVDRFELADVAHFAPAAALKSAVAAQLRIDGPLSEFGATGWITTDAGGRFDVRKLGLRLPTPEVPLGHEVDLLLSNVDPGEVPGVAGLPTLNGEVAWIGEGTGPSSLRGEARVGLRTLDFQGLRVEKLDLAAQLEPELIVSVPQLAVELGGGRITGTAGASVPGKTFEAELAGRIADLSALQEISRGAVTAGQVDLDLRATGAWGGDVALALQTDGGLTAAGLGLPSTRIDHAKVDWDLAVAVGEGTPSVHGPVTLDVHGVSAAGQAIQQAALTATLGGRNAAFGLAADRDELHVELDGAVDWADAPNIALDADRLQLVLPDWELATPQGDGFRFTIEDKVLDLDGLSLVDAAGTTLFARADFDPAGPVDALVRLRGFDLARVDTILGLVSQKPLGIAGRTKQIEVELTNSLAKPKLRVDVGLREVVAYDRPPLDLDVALLATDGLVSGTVGLDSLAALRIGKLPLTLRLDGQGAPAVLAPKGEWDVELDLPQGDMKALEPLIGITLPEQVVSGAYSGGVNITGFTLDPSVRAALSLSDVDVADRRLNARVGVQVDGGELSFKSSQLKTAEEGTILALRGQARTQLGPMLLAVLGPEATRPAAKPMLLDGLEFGVDVRNLPMSLVHVVSPAARPLTGALRGKVDVGGSLESPRLDAQVELLDGKAGAFELKRTRIVEVALVDGRLTAAVDLQARERGRIGATMSVGFPLVLQPMTPVAELLGQEDLDVQITSEGFPLGVPLAFVQGMYDVNGDVRLDGRVTGSLKAPVPDVKVLISGAEACYGVTATCFRDIELDSKVLPEEGNRVLRLQVSQLSAIGEPQVYNPIDRVGRPVNRGQLGSVSASGFVKLVDFRPQDVELDVQLGERKAGRPLGFWAMFTEEIQFQLLGGLKVRGVLPALQVTGDIDVNNVNVNLGQDDTSRKVEPLNLPEELRVHRETSRRGPGERLLENVVAGAQEEPSLVQEIMAASDMDVGVHLTNNVAVKLNVGMVGKGNGALDFFNAIGNVQPDLVLTGDIRFQQTGGRTLLTGGIETARGSTLTVLTKEFKLVDGSGVTFIGDPGAAQLGFEADFVTADYGTVTVVVSGPASLPKIEFRSDVGYDQSDIMSILVTGKPLDELSAAEGQTVFSQAANGLAGMLTNVLGKYAPVDALEVDIGDDPTTGTAEVGKAILPNLFVSSRFRWGADDDENVVEGKVEWQPVPNVRLELYVGDKLKGAFELVFKMRY